MLILIQARMSSGRLPGKVLRPLAGRPMLAWLIERLGHARSVDVPVVATSQKPDDDPIDAFCTRAGVRCFRGPLDDVAERLASAAESAGAEAFVRVSGDSPLMSPQIVDDLVALYGATEVDLATNVQTRTFPKGLSVEVIRVAALRRAQKAMHAGEAEHVTSAFYRRPSDFRIVNLTSGGDWGAIQMSVDTAEDLVLAERMLASSNGLTGVHSVRELVALRARCAAEQAA
jgi:spore coat polysaccharide biosynthesis protein SpsF (cytidylyltransferase family)